METQNNSATSSNVQRISSLDEHRSLLREVFRTAKSKIVVVSPFITSKALISDYIPSQIKTAVGRGVSVHVFTDHKLNCDETGSFKQTAMEGITDLTASGAQVKIVHGIHNKTLTRDDDLIAEGSFNWLSAVRMRGGENQREERTMVVQGEQAKEMIEKEVLSLEGKGGTISKNEIKVWEISTGKQIFRWTFAITFMLFMLIIAVGAKDKGVSILAYAGAGVSIIMMVGFLRNNKEYYSSTTDISIMESTEIEEDVEESDASSLSNQWTDSITKAGYIGVFDQRRK